MGTCTRLPPTPPTPFLQAVARSGLVSADDLAAVLDAYDPAQLSAAGPVQVAAFLVRKRLLTKLQAMQLLRGRAGGFRLGRYTIRDGLGEDRVGMVFLADAGGGPVVAVKVLPTDRVADPAAYRAFLADVRATARVTHPAVARILDMGMAHNTHYVVFEHVPAPTLDRVVADGGPLAPAEAARVVAQAAAGLAAAHAAGVVHRDVRPATLARLPDGRVKVLGLGATRLLDDPWGRPTKRLKLAEYAAEVAHLPPEQAWGVELDARADVYGLGSTAYHLLTGRDPFPGPAAEAMMARQARGVPSPPGVPGGLAEVVQRMGARDPADRYASAAEAVAALRPWVPVAEWVGLGLPLDR